MKPDGLCGGNGVIARFFPRSAPSATHIQWVRLYMRGRERSASEKKGSGLDAGAPALLKKEMSCSVPYGDSLRYPRLDLFGQPRDAALAELDPFGKSAGVFQSRDVHEAVRDAIDGLQLFLASPVSGSSTTP